MIRLFRHYVPRSLLWLALIEIALLSGAIYLGRILRIQTAPYDLPYPTVADLLLEALMFTLVMLLIMIGMGLYERNFWDGKADMVLRVSVSFMLGLFVMTLVYYLLPDLYMGRVEFSYSFALAFAGIILARFAFLKLSDQEVLKRRILVLGAGERALELEQLVGQMGIRGFRIIGYVPTHYSHPALDPTRLLLTNVPLFTLTEEHRIDEIVVATDDMHQNFPTTEVLDCKIHGVEVIDLLTFFERETGKIKLDALQPGGMIFSDGFHQAVLKTAGKRLFDIAASMLLLVLTWPIMLLTVLAIFLESGGRGPILYRQERVGRDEKKFEVLKFRSMRTDAEKDGVARWASKGDNRVTRVGAFIRVTRIDELPQLINVLRGQMSFVGPRPERPQFVAELNKTIPFYAVRHRVNPGITGWAQICYPYGASIEDAREKLQYDLYYIKNYSLFLDFVVLLQTAHAILWGKGAR